MKIFNLFVFRMSASSWSSSFSSPWPDPNSPVLSKIDFGVPLVELFKWLDVRDILLDRNLKTQDITAALALARDCKHPDAVWLTSIFEGKDVSTKEDARNVFLSFENDARALCFAWFLSDGRWNDLSPLRRAAEMGNSFASSLVCGEEFRRENKEEAFRLARFTAAQHERDGFFWLGHCFREGKGCEKDLNLAKENYLIAAELGHVIAAFSYGHLLDESDPARWIWWERTAVRGVPYLFLQCFPKQVDQFFFGSGNALIVFLIGRTLKGNIDMEKKEIFGSTYIFDSYIGPANQAVSFYDSQIKCARLAVDTWTMLATRMHLIKDMRIYIGKMIWEARFEANYRFHLDDFESSSSYSSSQTNSSSASSSSASSPVLKRFRK